MSDAALGDSAVALAPLLQTVRPPDDAGAETFDRYEWQAMMATADLLALYLGALEESREPSGVADCGLVCEYHEDWAQVLHGEVELVSGKHKELSFGAYTTPLSLAADGGLYHLFERWVVLGTTSRCRLVTTAGLASVVSKIDEAARQFRVHGVGVNLVGADVQDAFDRLTKVLAERRAASKAASKEVAWAKLSSDLLPRFLAGMTFQCGAPRREHLPTLAPAAYAGPIARKLGRADVSVEIWEAVLSLVRSRMRAAGPVRRGLLPTLSGGGPDDLERRTVTVADAHVAITQALAAPAGYARLPTLLITNKMAVKMNEGRCAATSIDRAETLRKRYAAFRRGQRSRPGGREAEVDIDLLLRRVADRATAATRRGDAWGAALWAELEDQLAAEVGTGPAARLDLDMLLGAVAELTNNCGVWFSEYFDATARVRALREAAA